MTDFDRITFVLFGRSPIESLNPGGGLDSERAARGQGAGPGAGLWQPGERGRAAGIPAAAGLPPAAGLLGYK